MIIAYKISGMWALTDDEKELFDVENAEDWEYIEDTDTDEEIERKLEGTGLTLADVEEWK